MIENFNQYFRPYSCIYITLNGTKNIILIISKEHHVEHQGEVELWFSRLNHRQKSINCRKSLCLKVLLSEGLMADGYLCQINSLMKKDSSSFICFQEVWSHFLVVVSMKFCTGKNMSIVLNGFFCFTSRVVLQTFTILKFHLFNIQHNHMFINFLMTDIKLKIEGLRESLPSYEDLHGSVSALLRLQDTYKLDTNELASGNVGGVESLHLTGSQPSFINLSGHKRKQRF